MKPFSHLPSTAIDELAQASSHLKAALGLVPKHMVDVEMILLRVLCDLDHVKDSWSART